jgi:hypothetical protein
MTMILNILRTVVRNKTCFVFVLTLTVIPWGCSDFIQTDPPSNRLVKSVVFSDDNSAISAITGIYTDLSVNSFASGLVTFLAGYSADEFRYFSTDVGYVQFFQNSVLPANGNISSLWNSCYHTIYLSNSAIEGLSNANGVTSSVKGQLIGEAKFLRAFAHFYLTVLFGDVPVVMTTDVNVNRNVNRSSQADVFRFIEKDLLDAKELLPDSYSNYNNERIRVTKYAAAAMLARLYLYTKEWQRAEVESSRVIDRIDLYGLLPQLDKVFLKNSKEAIWQLVPRAFGSTIEANTFILSSVPNLVSLRDQFVITFGVNDLRRVNWIGTFTDASDVYYYPFKYRARGAASLVEYSMVLRIAEQYLIRAEARLNLNKVSGFDGAQSDLNSIRNRAGLSNTTAMTSDAIMMEIMAQRQFELFTEWGHRWLDLKRTNQATSVLQTFKPFFQSTSVLYPLPQYELANNHNLSQNPGYSN